ncbi:MAG: acyl-CoA desaturase [Gemmataceae bacterium]|nr:acyl-CoA desaturase [Gemmataceae bacterium]
MADIMSVASAPEAATAREQEAPREESGRRPKFDNDSGFQGEVRRRVEEFLRATGRRQRDCPQMYVKTAVIFAWLALSYALLLFVVAAWWQALLVAVSLGLAMAAIGFNIQHDGAHHAYSRHAWVNKLMAMSVNLIGASSYFWHWQHNVFHHTYVNITGHDTDIDVGPFARLSPHQKRRWMHRWQHFYMWLLYGFMTMRWHFYGDFHDLIAGKVGAHKVPRPRGWELVVFLGGKAVFLLGLALPLLVHPVWVVLLFYITASLVVGLAMSIVFQLAHCVPEADFPLPRSRMEKPWAVHQVETTVDYARRSWVFAWLLGGLNFQIEHHLFPRICHVNYPAIAGLVEETCREYGVRYAEHESVLAGLLSHFRWLRQMGTTG